MDFLEQVKSSVDIVKVVGEYVRLKKAGGSPSYKGLCPFHSGKRPSFSCSARTSVKSKEEAIEWVKRCPNPFLVDSESEIRQVFSPEDFAPVMTAEIREQEHRIRTRISKGNQCIERLRFTSGRVSPEPPGIE